MPLSIPTPGLSTFLVGFDLAFESLSFSPGPLRLPLQPQPRRISALTPHALSPRFGPRPSRPNLPTFSRPNLQRFSPKWRPSRLLPPSVPSQQRPCPSQPNRSLFSSPQPATARRPSLSPIQSLPLSRRPALPPLFGKQPCSGPTSASATFPPAPHGLKILSSPLLASLPKAPFSPKSQLLESPRALSPALRWTPRPAAPSWNLETFSLASTWAPLAPSSLAPGILFLPPSSTQREPLAFWSPSAMLPACQRPLSGPRWPPICRTPFSMTVLSSASGSPPTTSPSSPASSLFVAAL
ncbi:unknown [Switchgrass mosaic virus]|uniref:hypothetical protein n=1 Tax=Switchgrass mosaic virus TaxID=1027869 RepID=UPI00020C1DB1|nr:unknown [Switchgrass mosaic virus]AEE25898.2 unknown [Switchgrass mosaic virus]